MNCFFCKGSMKPSTTTHFVDLKKCMIIVKNVPCWECMQCGVIVLDDDFCQPYYPFYDETQDFKMVNLVIRKYNEAMDELVSLGILNEKEPQTREIEPRRRRDKRG